MSCGEEISAMVHGSKTEPPCDTPGGGDLTSRQRRLELQVLRLKIPPTKTVQSLPRSRARSQRAHASGDIEMRRRAASLQDRTSSPRVTSRGRVATTPRRRRSMPAMPDADADRQDAGRRVCQTLALNAWRAQRSEAARLRGEAVQLKEQLGKEQRATETLRELLDDEKLRVAGAQQDAQRLSSLLAEGIEDRAHLDAQVQQLDAQLGEADRRLLRAEETRANFHNNLLTAKTSWTALDGLVARSTAQRARLLNQKLRLEAQRTARTNEITAQQATLLRMHRRSKELQTELEQKLDELRTADEEQAGATGRRDELETQRAQLLEEAAGMRAQRESLSELLDAQAQQIARRVQDIEHLEGELTSHVSRESSLRQQVADLAARLSVTWFERLRGALSNELWSWLRTRGRLH